MQQHPPDTADRTPGAPHPRVPADHAGAPHPNVPAGRAPGTPHPLARQGRDPARAKRQSLLYSVLALVTLPAPPLPFLFAAWAIARASDAGKTGRPALGQVLGVIALVLSTAALATAVYLFPAFIRFFFTVEEFNPWLWWM
jgi:hypothetical protein